MIIESRWMRDLLNTSILSTKAAAAPSHLNDDDAAWTPPKTYRVSLNPLPGLIILLLGLMMSAHHQHSMLSTMVHKQWGTLFVGFAFARAVTYVLLYLSPPSSYLPARPPSELVAAFCLVAGGITFILSNKNTVSALEAYGLDAMFTFVLTVAATGLVMAWSLVCVALKGWAVRREHGELFVKDDDEGELA